MSVSIESIQRILQILDDNKIKNLGAQSDARRVLQEVGELSLNFPNYDPHLSEKNSYIAYLLIFNACDIVENSFENQISSAEIFERAGKLLADNYQFAQEAEDISNINLLISSMSFYCAKQFSQAYISVEHVKPNNSIVSMVKLFLRKDFNQLFTESIENFFVEQPYLSELDQLDQWIISHEIARCFMIYLNTLYSGDLGQFNQISFILETLEDLCELNRFVTSWLIIKLLKIIFKTFETSSTWKNIPPRIPNASLTPKYIRLLSELRPSVVELWPSQLSAIDLATSKNDGGVINLRTSSGKTRVAEIAILNTLAINPESKVLYLAPFRSLAFEIEKSLLQVFGKLGFGVSQLYGGSTANKTDLELFSDNQIIIATPEKAKAMMKSDDEFINQIELIIVDEGHLIGKEFRNIKNEIFLTHISEIAKNNGKRILLLSAVLPNANEIAEWLTGDESAVSKSSWKPSLERFGILNWNGEGVTLRWLNGEKPFNPNFIEKKPLGFSKRRKHFPNSKNEAVAATAVRLSKSGPVMILSARANSIRVLAGDVLLAMGEAPNDYEWDENLWDIVESTCEEELGVDSIEIKAARKGIICHSNRLTTNVRIVLEQLMRSKPPKIVIASSTLAQGVNIGISTIIVSTPYYAQDPISKRDFWNVCGRAGRAFSDSEGKILYAIDLTKESWQIQKDLSLARDYYQGVQTEKVQSGLYYLLNRIYEISLISEVTFDTLLEKIANDTFVDSLLEEQKSEVHGLFDLIDDELLSMNQEFQSLDADLSWIDNIFRNSLAFIQSKDAELSVYPEILKARTKFLLQETVTLENRRMIISTGLPFSVAQKMVADIDYFRDIASDVLQNYYNDEVETVTYLLKAVEVWASKFASSIIKSSYDSEILDSVRNNWITGISINEMREITTDINEIVKDYFGYTLPWILNGIAQIFYLEDREISKLYSKIATLTEFGLPSNDAVKIYLCGIKSRAAAIEISALSEFKTKSMIQLRKLLSDYSFEQNELSLTSKKWISIFRESYSMAKSEIISFPIFNIKDWKGADNIVVRKVDQNVYLSTVDGYYFISVKSTKELPFEKIANIPGVFFVRKETGWHIQSNSSRIEIE